MEGTTGAAVEVFGDGSVAQARHVVEEELAAVNAVSEELALPFEHRRARRRRPDNDNFELKMRKRQALQERVELEAQLEQILERDEKSKLSSHSKTKERGKALAREQRHQAFKQGLSARETAVHEVKLRRSMRLAKKAAAASKQAEMTAERQWKHLQERLQKLQQKQEQVEIAFDDANI